MCTELHPFPPKRYSGEVETIRSEPELANERRNILVVEDSPSDLFLIKSAIAECEWPHQMEHVSNGEQALDFLHRRGSYTEVWKPDLILLDLNLPRIDGFGVLEELKSNVSFRTIPIVILSTSSTRVDVAKAYDLQANCFVTKQPDVTAFFQSVCAILRYWFGTARLLPNSAAS